MKKKLIYGIFIFAILFLASCTATTTGENSLTSAFEKIGLKLPTLQLESPTGQAVVESNISLNFSQGNETSVNETVNETTEFPIAKYIYATEGDLIVLKPKAFDPDGDEVTYYFSEPFNEEGIWQTNEGDAGKYLVKVTASDGKTNVSKYVMVIVKKANKAPIINCPDNLTAREGEKFTLNCEIYDLEGDPIVVEYSGWMTSNEKEVGYDEQGKHVVIIKARDKYKTNVKEVTVYVENVNRKPRFVDLQDEYVFTEEDLVSIKPTVVDPDGDKVTITYSGPLNSKGEWQTKIGDYGEYEVTITASDGIDEVSKVVKLIVKKRNTPPQLKPIGTIEVNEGEEVVLPIEAYDREGDSLVLTISGWMNSTRKKTTYDDAGIHYVTVEVSDGEYSVKETVKIVVHDVNRPPVFIVPA